MQGLRMSFPFINRISIHCNFNSYSFIQRNTYFYMKNISKIFDNQFVQPISSLKQMDFN
ncbi:hypothetical protein pb186bvf_000233 [Paramecium bursaria]